MPTARWTRPSALGGTVTTDFAGDDVATAMAIQSNGDILLAGYSELNGSSQLRPGPLHREVGSLGIDKTFGSDGRGDHRVWRRRRLGHGVAVQGDGQIVVSGTTLLDGSGNIGTATHFALARYNTDGSPDDSFGGTCSPPGTVTTDFSTLGFSTESAAGVMVDANGRLIVAGTASTSPLPPGEGQGEGYTAALPYPATIPDWRASRSRSPTFRPSCNCSATRRPRPGRS